MSRLVSVLAVAFALFVPQLSLAGDAAEMDRLLAEKGWVIDKLEITGAETPGVRHMTVSGRFSMPADAIWNAIAYQDDSDWPGIDDAVVESSNGDTTVCRYKIAVPVFHDRRYRIRIINDDDRMEEVFHQVPGYGNVKAIDGKWMVQPISRSLTRVEYVLDTDPGVKLVPGFILNWATKRMVPGVYEQIYRSATRDAAKLVRSPE